MRAWGEAPIIIPRWALAVKYALFVILGAAVGVATAPSLEAVTSEWYTSAWGAATSLSALVALVGSAYPKRWVVEATGCAGIVSLMAVYALSPIILIIEGDTDRLAYSVIAVTFMVLPTARGWQLIRGGANA